MKKFGVAISYVCALWVLAHCACAVGLKSDERVIFYPTSAYLTANGKIEIPIAAWVYESESRPGAKEALALWLDVDLASLSAEEKVNFETRTQLFRFDSERRKQLKINFGAADHYRLPPTNSHGLTYKNIRMDAGKIGGINSNIRWLPYTAVLSESDQRVFTGEVMLVPAKGLSVVSDIDDTIKDSHVLDRQELLLNTFVRPFKVAQGMREFYQALVGAHKGIAFHYVSGSPHQLYPVLDNFLREQDFPKGSMHLRQVKITEELFRKGSSSERHKHAAIRALLQQYPQRQFVLIGDSGEADPEIYADVARDYPEQVRAIYIRDVTGETGSAPRYQKTFRQLPASLWQVFTRPAHSLTLLP